MKRKKMETVFQKVCILSIRKVNKKFGFRFLRLKLNYKTQICISNANPDPDLGPKIC